jgi:ABC-2 type transport system ATP-binding protein
MGALTEGARPLRYSCERTAGSAEPTLVPGAHLRLVEPPLTIEAHGLRKEYAGVVAVDGIDLAIRKGEVFGFLGANGAGKTTTVRMLTTLLSPSAGRAMVAGFDLATEPHLVRRSIGVALQDAGLDDMATGWELLVIQAQLFGLRGSEAVQRAADLLDLVGLTEVADRRVGSYSGGMRRRLDLASALIHGPRVLFLDEPTVGLDPPSRRAIWDEIRRLNREWGITVLLTTQYMEEADQLAERVAIIDRGRIVSEGTPSTLKGSIGRDVVTVAVDRDHRDDAHRAISSLEGLTEVRADDSGLRLMVDDGSSSVAKIVRLLDEARVPIGPLAVSHPTLDEVFLRATATSPQSASAQPTAVAVIGGSSDAEPATATAPRNRSREAIRAALLLGLREIRVAVRMPAMFIPNLLMPLAWFFIMTGSFEQIASRGGVANWKAFQLPVAIVFATMSGSAGLNMVTDIERGYFDKLLLTPASRLAVLVGAMGADFVRITGQGALVLAAAMLTGIEPATGLSGAVVLVLLAALWGLAFSAIGFAIALKTGNPQTTQAIWFLFAPFMFLTTAFAPLNALSGWLRTGAVLNPVTYVLDGMRALTMSGWNFGKLGLAVVAAAGAGAVTLTLAFRALLGRIR